ncbi:PAS domain S-box-containing protein [Actinoallomurus bryophytorum]|uniref:PAS domain S-box-containing protein n=1 Tax=Actinoallomurus bryophytorum TaxID=1490222 RepID=A0A543CTU2_9ACTN|nr:MEKHLA domain-containing protein [Actinoallomurus bryophytorum]TQM00451.1 PAS domain S-box-containing protein [Actinoallomurus bryophytorum]
MTSPDDVAFAELLAASHERVVGTRILPEGLAGAEAARWLYGEAPFGLLAHDTSADPAFVYANATAQKCFEYSWEEFAGMPSRLSAEADNRDKRQEFMDGVLRQGYVSGYRGVRIAKSGRRFWIEDTTVWNLLDRDGGLRGQAALIRGWADV